MGVRRDTFSLEKGCTLTNSQKVTKSLEIIF